MTVATDIDLQKQDVLSRYSMPMTFRPVAFLSDDELMALSDRNELYRIERNVAGELEVRMSPGTQGGYRETLVTIQLGQWAEIHGGITCGPDTGFSLPDGSMRKPDISWTANARFQALNRFDRERYSPLCPDFVIEVVSKTDSRKTVEAKMQMWLDNGAQLAWMIDPYLGDVQIYKPGVAVEVLNRPEFVEAGEPVPGFRLSTRRLWAE